MTLEEGEFGGELGEFQDIVATNSTNWSDQARMRQDPSPICFHTKCCLLIHPLYMDMWNQPYSRLADLILATILTFIAVTSHLDDFSAIAKIAKLALLSIPKQHCPHNQCHLKCQNHCSK